MLVRTYVRVEGELRPVGEAPLYAGDPHYVEGAVTIEHAGKVVLGLEHADLVDQLWAYLVDGLRVLHETGRFQIPTSAASCATVAVCW